MCQFVEKCWNRRNLTFDDLWWPDPWPDLKNDRCGFVMIFSALSNAAYLVSLRGPGAEIEGVSQEPPSGGGKSRGPSGRGLTYSLPRWLNEDRMNIKHERLGSISYLLPCVAPNLDSSRHCQISYKTSLKLDPCDPGPDLGPDLWTTNHFQLSTRLAGEREEALNAPIFPAA